LPTKPTRYQTMLACHEANLAIIDAALVFLVRETAIASMSRRDCTELVAGEQKLNRIREYLVDQAACLLTQPAALRLVEMALSPERVDIHKRSAQEAEALAYYPSFLCCVTLPASRVKEAVYERESGPFKVRIVSAYGIPFGVYPRILIAAITTYVTKRKNAGLETRKVYLGSNFNDCIKELLGVDYLSGGRNGNLTRFKQQYRSTITSRIYWWQNKYSRRMPAPYDIAIDWQEAVQDPPQLEDHILWKAHREEVDGPKDGINFSTTLTLGEYFHRDICEHSPQIDARIFRELSKTGACLPVDLYVWLTYRANALKSEHRWELRLSWDMLKMQFGAGYVDMKGFRKRLIPALHRVALYYRGFSFAEDKGMMVFTLLRTSVAGPLTALGTGTDGGRGLLLDDPPEVSGNLFS
jgi:Plasmid encoded RepA protein